MKSPRPSPQLCSLLLVAASSSNCLAYSTSQIETAYLQTALGRPSPLLLIDRRAAGVRASKRRLSRDLDSFRALGLWIRCPVWPELYICI